ncbi:MAG: hypothetical protein J6X55_01335 [Victivallales bacterium]|nr:hypothetical protein [Victivallales bacterium]
MRHHLKTAVKLLLLIIVVGAAYYHFRLSPVVTHDTRALDVFDRILHMEDGRIRE